MAIARHRHTMELRLTEPWGMMTIGDLRRLPSVLLREVDSLPAVTAAYAAIWGDEVLYVGKANDLHRRWIAHHKAARLSEYTEVRIHWLEGTAAETALAEVGWCATFRPKLNQQQPQITSAGRIIAASAGRHMFTFMNVFQLCIRHKLRGEVRSVLDWLCMNIFRENLVSGVSQKDIRRDTGVSQANISKALARMEGLRILLREGRGEILLNPRLFFLGTPAEQHRACRIWDEKWAGRDRTEDCTEAAGDTTEVQAVKAG